MQLQRGTPRPTLAAYNILQGGIRRAARMNPLLKPCAMCKEPKPLIEFGKRQDSPEGVQPYCKLCQRQHNREEQRTLRLYYKELIYGKLGKQCKHCGFSDERALQIDHVHGNFMQQKKDRSTITFLKKVLADNTGLFQILCANCNWIKRHTNNELPARTV